MGINRHFHCVATTAVTFVLIGALGMFAGCAGGTMGDGGGAGSGNGNDNGGGAGGGNDNGGNNGGGGGGNGNGSGGSGSQGAVVKTQIIIGNNGKIEAGDDLLVYGVFTDEDVETAAVTNQGFNQEVGVYFFTPSAVSSDLDGGTFIPGSDLLFSPRNFKVAQKKIALVRSTNAVTVFDTQDGSMVDIATGEITLFRNLPISNNTPGQMRSDGPYIVTINDPDIVADGNAIKVIDVSGPTPVVTSFVNPTRDDVIDPVVDNFEQVDIDADARRIVAVSAETGDDVYVWDMDDPSGPPQMFDFGGGTEPGLVGDNVQIQLEGDLLLFHDVSDFDPQVKLFDISDGSTLRLDSSDDGAAVAMAGGSLGYFMFAEDADREQASSTLVLRSAIGSATDPINVTRANQLNEYPFRSSVVDLSSAAGPVFGQDDCRELKRVGYGESMCILPDGGRWFIGGHGPVGEKDFILTNTGGAFEDLPDPEQTTVTGSLQGTDLVCTSNVVAFRGLRETGDGTGCITVQDWVISFIIPDRLEN